MSTKLPTKYVEEPPSLLCPVCKKIFGEPIISVKCGHTFCRACIEELNRNGRTCPLDDQECDSGQLVLNRAIMGQLSELRIYCRHGLLPVPPSQDSYEQDPDGCQEVICVGERGEHEENCQFAWVQCPVGQSLCGPIRRNLLENHKNMCANTPCPFADFGCKFTGSLVEVSAHKGNCSFKDETQLMTITMKELKALKLSNDELQMSLGRATKAIEKLTTERATMTIQLEQQALTITSLTSRMDQLETDFENYKSIRLRHSRRHMEHSEATPRSNRRDRNSTNDNKRWSTDSMPSQYLEAHRGGSFHWQMPFTVKCIGTFRGHKGTICSVVASGGHLYSSSSDGSIKIWDILDLRRGCLKTVSAHKDCVLCMTMGHGILYTSGTDLCIRSWHLDSMEEIGTVHKAHDGMACAMTCSKDYLFASFYGCIKIWDAISLKEVHKIESIFQSWVRAITYDKRKDMLYSCSSNKLHIWKCYGDFNLVKDFETQYGSLYSLATTKKYIITGTHSHNIQVYNISSLEHLHNLSGHIGRVTVLCVTESQQGDREYMFSGSSDATVTVWDLENMLPILTLKRHEKAVHSLAIWHDAVFSGSEDMEIKVFRHFKL